MALSNSKKVTLTSKIIANLENEEWPIIDFTLKQFGFPTTDLWDGTMKAYLVEMLSNGNDSNLVELAEHFDSDEDPGSAEALAADLPYWEGDNLRVFISHLSDNKGQAAILQEHLASYGMSCFVAHKDIHPTAEWQSEIEAALQTCELLIAVISPGFKESNWCDQEIGWALGRGIPVFTIRWDADPHGFVSRFQAFAGKGKKPEAVALAVFDAALAHKMLQQRMADVCVTLFVESHSFEASKKRIAYLEKLAHWEPSYSKRIKKAAEENSQISHSFGVPEKVKALVTKWKKAGVS